MSETQTEKTVTTTERIALTAIGPNAQLKPIGSFMLIQVPRGAALQPGRELLRAEEPAARARLPPAQPQPLYHQQLGNVIYLIIIIIKTKKIKTNSHAEHDLK